MDSDHSREQSHVERVESHVQNIKTRRCDLIYGRTLLKSWE